MNGARHAHERRAIDAGQARVSSIPLTLDAQRGRSYGAHRRCRRALEHGMLTTLWRFRAGAQQRGQTPGRATPPSVARRALFRRLAPADSLPPPVPGRRRSCSPLCRRHLAAEMFRRRRSTRFTTNNGRGARCASTCATSPTVNRRGRKYSRPMPTNSSGKTSVVASSSATMGPNRSSIEATSRTEKAPRPRPTRAIRATSTSG